MEINFPVCSKLKNEITKSKTETENLKQLKIVTFYFLPTRKLLFTVDLPSGNSFHM